MMKQVKPYRQGQMSHRPVENSTNPLSLGLSDTKISGMLRGVRANPWRCDLFSLAAVALKGYRDTNLLAADPKRSRADAKLRLSSNLFAILRWTRVNKKTGLLRGRVFYVGRW